MRYWVLVGVLLAVTGCSVTKKDIADLSHRHDAALNSAIDRLSRADQHLQKDPPDVGAARGEIGGAKTDIRAAQDVAKEITNAANVIADERDQIKAAFFSPRQKAIAISAGATLALLGVIIVLLRFGKTGGAIAAIPLIGALLVRIGVVKNPKSVN
jgi:hypothetical protein